MRIGRVREELGNFDRIRNHNNIQLAIRKKPFGAHSDERMYGKCNTHRAYWKQEKKEAAVNNLYRTQSVISGEIHESYFKNNNNNKKGNCEESCSKRIK